jgi:pantetheine-phosphate adenylyltransferase
MPVAAQPGNLLAIYPGSFDPITNGHLDLIGRSARLVEKLVVAILHNPKKSPLFTVDERLAMLREAVQPWGNVDVDSFEGLLVDYASKRGANLIIRGIRAISDYEHEWQMALMNRRLSPDIETMFMMAGEAHAFISSHLVKEVLKLGGDISDLVPPVVERHLKQRFV